MSSVQLKNIAYRIAGRPLLRGLNLRATTGQYVVLLGPSGCGKTTTLRLIAGLLRPDAGDILIGDHSVLDTPPRNRDVSFVFQNDALYPHMTVGQTIRFGIEHRPTPKHSIGDEPSKAATPRRRSTIAQRVERAIALTGIESIVHRTPEHLSGGERRRVSLARAIARDAPVRLLDEPLSALDASVRFNLQQDILRWHRSDGGTTIHVTHDGQEAMRMADVIAVMDQGRIVQCDVAERIYQEPATLAVAKAVGLPPVECFLVEPGDGRLYVESAEPHGQPPAHGRGRMIAAVRPHDWHLVPLQQSPQAGISITAELIGCCELGSDVQVTLQQRERIFTLLLPRHQAESLTSLHTSSSSSIKRPMIRALALWEHVHWFDADSGQRLPASQPA